MFQLMIEHWPITLLVVTVIATIVFAKYFMHEQPLPYEKRKSLLTKSELAFYRVLKEAVDGRWSVQAMVRLADLIRVRPKTPKFQSWQNRIHAKHIDFLLCEHGSMEAKLAVELDDSSHKRPDRVDRDQFVDKALSDAGVPLLRVDVQSDYNADALRKSILEKFA